MSSGQVDFPRPFSTRQILRPTIPSAPWRPKKFKKLTSLSSDIEYPFSHQPIEYVTHMTQTDSLQWKELATDRPNDTTTLWTRKKVRCAHGSPHKRTFSLPEDSAVSFLLTPTKSIAPISPYRLRLYSQLEPRPPGFVFSVRGSGFRQRFPRSKFAPGTQFISLKEKLHTVVKGRKATLNDTSKVRHKSVSEAMTLTD